MPLREQSINMMNNSNIIGRPSNKLNQSVDKRSESQVKKIKLAGSSTTKIERKLKAVGHTTSKLDTSINYGRVAMTKSI